MYPETKCFYIEKTGRAKRYARRYHSSSDESEKCDKSGYGYHNIMIFIDEIQEETNPEGYIHTTELPAGTIFPTHCSCGYEFTDKDAKQTFQESLYVNKETGEETTLEAAKPGAMWDGWWYSDMFKGNDGRCLIVKLPNGRDWIIDSRASNCTKPEDTTHKCWPRSGTPPNITVGKEFGNTCSAGAGSIMSGDYHGFLRNGYLTAG